MRNRKAKKKWTLAFDESGAAAIFIVVIFSVICGVIGLAVDIGHVYKVRAELQRTADAGALAGVTGLVPYTGSVPKTPWWGNGETTAHTIISIEANIADKLAFTDTEVTVNSGYWLLKPPTDYVQPPTTGLPKARPTNETWLPEPAIQVTLSKKVTLYLAPMVNYPSPMTVSATATAILPEAYYITGAPPIAVSGDAVYDIIGGIVQLDVVEQEIKIQSNKGIAGWFNLNGGNSVGSVRDDKLVADPNDILKGSKVYMVPGMKATLTDFITEGMTSVVPIVEDFSQKEWVPIIGWAAFKVDELGANTMTGHFIPIANYYSPDASPDERPNPTTLFISGTPKLVSP